MAAPFESFINHILSANDSADKLRELTNLSNTTKLEETVESMLAEQEIKGQFDFNGYDSEERKLKVLDKLYEVRNKISSKYYPNDKEYMTVLLCIKYVAEGYALTPSITEYLNTLYKQCLAQK